MNGGRMSTESRLMILHWYPISPIVLHKETKLKKETSPFSSQLLYLIGLVNHKEKNYFDHPQGVNHDNSKESRESQQRCYSSQCGGHEISLIFHILGYDTLRDLFRHLS